MVGVVREGWTGQAMRGQEARGAERESQNESQGGSHTGSNTVCSGDEASTLVTGDWAHGSQLLLSLWMVAGQGGVSDQWALVL